VEVVWAYKLGKHSHTSIQKRKDKKQCSTQQIADIGGKKSEIEKNDRL